MTTTQVKERPILFSGPMIRALLDGRKTQTRRVLKQRNRKDGCRIVPELLQQMGVGASCPYGQVGDRLWVRETFWVYPGIISDRLLREGADTWPEYFYDADCDRDWCIEHGWVRKPSIFMPREACRFMLDITDVRVERLWDITESDAISEGVQPIDNPDYDEDDPCDDEPESYVAAFRELWDELNQVRGYGWDANPWVWVIEFKRIN
jgi:hypothetical protein